MNVKGRNGPVTAAIVRGIVVAGVLMHCSAVDVPRANAQVSACGRPVSLGDTWTATDARFTLLAAIGARVCDLCVCDVDRSGTISATDALAVSRAAVELPVALDCASCNVDDQCAGVAQFVLFGQTRGACTTNSDCGGVGTCDTAIGRCATPTSIDIGWTGISHDQDFNDIVPVRLRLACAGPAPCGQCDVSDVDPQFGNCRCASDNRQICFTPHAPDHVSCGGGRCECYFGPPLPISAGSSPTCVVNQVKDALSGAVDPDQGSGTIIAPLRELVYLGDSLLSPCPVCTGDALPGDGRRDGICEGGRNDGQSCDAQSANATFPAPGGGRGSLDCFPTQSANVSGTGLEIEIALSTGTTSLDADIPCRFAAVETCPCGLCTGDTSVACSSDAECATLGAGTCSAAGAAIAPEPHACSDGVCTAVGGALGRCMDGPNDSFCDGVTRANGRGIIACNVDADCEPAAVGVDAGACTLTEARACFLDPIVATGAPNPVLPIAADVFCSPATSSTSVNAVAGLPGPVRWTQFTQVTSFCATKPLQPYTPGVGGCQ